MKVENWDTFWRSVGRFKLLDRLTRAVTWRKYERFLKKIGRQNLKILELGSGYGLHTLKILKKYGGTATLVDYSDYVIEKSKKIFEKEGIKATHIRQDLFNLDLKEKFTLVHSEGLLEHFYDEKRSKILQIHAQYTSPDGHLLIFVPTMNRRYRIAQRLFKLFNIIVDEKPFTEEEFTDIANKHRLEIIDKTRYLLFWEGFLLRNHAAN